MRPALPRYNVTWNVDIVLNYLQTPEPFKELTLLHVSHKLLMLLALLSGQRGQTLHLLDIRNICIYDDCVKIGIGDLLKTSSPGKHVGELNFPSYPNDERPGIVRVMRHYLQRTKDLRKSYNFIYRDAETPQRGVQRYHWEVDEISPVCGWNRHQRIQTPQCSIRAQTPDGYYLKDCWMEK